MRSAKFLAPLERVGAGMTCALLLIFTAARVAVADSPPGDSPARWIEDPYSPHDTTGTNLRVGSAVGALVHDGKAYTALGGMVAAGPRMGRVTFEADYLYLELSEVGPSSRHYGRAQRLGAFARADVVRMGPRMMGANSMLALYAELGAARQWHHWSRLGRYAPETAVPIDSSLTTGVVGFGINLDHRFQQLRGFPNRVGWQLGWQLTSSPTHAANPTVVCRGPTCVSGPTVARAPSRDSALLVTSTIAVTW